MKAHKGRGLSGSAIELFLVLTLFIFGSKV